MSTTKPPASAATRVVRVAIYTRKSSEEGLAQEFNSLDAQREACEAYIASQRNEGWVCLPERYDDGGFSGGNIERPALQKLLRDIEAGRVDCIAVYKVDRLSRSLLDFAKLLEVFEKRSVSFVSVTQRFSTADSMGRLLLNVLLSFAQFEREIIGERIRDKIGAQRRKGRWTGGTPVLGYDVDRSGRSPRLVVNGAEAARVREIFDLYIDLGSLLPVVNELDKRHWRTKAWQASDGTARGGRPFDKGSLYALLTNPVVAGRVRHKSSVYQGEHEAIVDADIFERVQAQLRSHGRGGGSTLRNKHGALLRGLLHCKGCGRAMVHTFAGRGTRLYRYYTCSNSIKRGRAGCASGSLPAAEVERSVVDEVRAIASDPGLQVQVVEQCLAQQRQERLRIQEERRGLLADLGRYEMQVRKATGTTTPQTARRLAELDDLVRSAQGRLAELDEDERRACDRAMDEHEVRQAFMRFESAWSELSPKEQGEVLRLLVRRVDYDREDGSLEISFHDSRLSSLGGGSAEAAA